MNGKRLLRTAAICCAAALSAAITGALPASAAALEITKSGGWYETAYVEWSNAASGVEVYYKKSSDADSAYVRADAELIRGSRADIPGLSAEYPYDVKVVSGSDAAVATIQTMANDRSGYAHWNYSSGVGAYNNDGTLKSGITVLYVNNSNKDSVSYNGQTGIYNILNKSSTANLDVRMLGKIDPPKGVLANDGSKNDGSHMVYLNQLKNVTIEGIGYDTHLVRWGMCLKKCESVELRNLYFYQYPDDAVGVQGSSASEMAKRIWIHNNDFGIGKNEYAGNGTVDDDKAEGDGSCDIKWTEYVTVSFNHFNDCHKTSLVGGGPSQFQDWITYHHNHFENCMSRSPRARNAHIHMYNNYFSGASSYSVGASFNSKIFTESNYFYKCSKALDMEAMGSDKYSGTIKSFNDKLDSCSGTSIYTAVNSRNASANIANLVGGGENYDNFDLDASKIYLNAYKTQSPEEARQTCIDYSGRMENKDYNQGTTGPVVVVEPLEGAQLDESKVYMFRNANSSAYMIAENGTAAAGTNVCQNSGKKAEAFNTWNLKAAADGYYYIYSCMGDGKTYLLDLDYVKTDNGTNIGIYTDTKSDAQLFKFVANGDGTYRIATKNTIDQSVIEVASAATEDGANVQQWETNGSSCQSWYVEEAVSAPEVTLDDVAGMKKFVHGTANTAPENSDFDNDGMITIIDVAIAKRTAE